MKKILANIPSFLIIGIVLLVVGLVIDNTALPIVGLVFLVIGIGAWRKSCAKNSKTDEYIIL